MKKHDLDINVSRLQTAKSHLWETQKALEQITNEVSDSNLKVKANQERIKVESVRSLIRDVESFLLGQEAN